MGRYTQEFKSEAIAFAIKSHRSHQEISLDLGINPSTFRNWMSEAMMTDSSKSKKVTKRSQADLEKELLAMKKELAFRQEEIEILKKGGGILRQKSKVKYAFLEQHRPDYHLSIERFCRLLSISVSGYYQWRKQPISLREHANNVLDEIILMLFKKHKRRYGYRRI